MSSNVLTLLGENQLQVAEIHAKLAELSFQSIHICSVQGGVDFPKDWEEFKKNKAAAEEYYKKVLDQLQKAGV